MKKLSPSEFLERAQAAAKRPVDLSKFNYTKSNEKSVAVCPTHREFLISANALMQGKGCHKCAVSERSKKQTLGTGGFIERAEKTHGKKYDYSKVVYTHNRNHVTITCRDHGDFTQNPSSHISGRGCPECAKISVGLSSTLDFGNFREKLFAKHPHLTPIEGSYKNASSPVSVVCPEHGQFEALAGNLIYNGSGCPKCSRKRVGAKLSQSLEDYVEKANLVHNGKYTYTGIMRRPDGTWLKIVCPEHGEFEQRAQDHLKGRGCNRCHKKMFDTQSFIKEASLIHRDKYDYSKASYVAALEKVTLVCHEHGPFEQRPACHVSLGQGCPICGGIGPSKGQLEIEETLSKYTDVIREWTIPGTRRRVDLYLPKFNLGVEYHGLIFHSSKYASDKRKDYKKHVLAEKSGVRLIHIYEDEWKFKRQVVERTLLSAIGALPKTHARKLKVLKIPRDEANTFYEAHHLQGASFSTANYGLATEGGTVVACMSFSMARSDRRNTDTSTWELERYAAACTIVGGASKLLAAFVKESDARRIVSYSDTRAFSGNMYKQLGFKLEHTTPPDYAYTTGSAKIGRVHKAKFQRKHLPTVLQDFDPTLSESANCWNNGWYQIFDCGKKKWVLSL